MSTSLVSQRYLSPRRKDGSTLLSASEKIRRSEVAFLAPMFLWVQTCLFWEVIIVSLGRDFSKDFANLIVWSSEAPSTTITSKSWKVCLERSSKSRGRYFSSLSAGMIIEKKGLWDMVRL